jgi:TonB-linked SusC/RagA family outer membrane protein
MKRTVLLLLMMLLIMQFAAAQINITGTVTSADDGLGIPGAFVLIKGTTNGTATDIDGKYSIKVPQGSTLIFSFVGLKSQEFVITDQTTLNVVLSSDVFKMEEVIVAGVASATPKNKMSVSVNKINSKELEAVPAASAATALQGKVAGITIINSSGNPGQSAGIRLRGSTSILGSQSPLIIIDGIMSEGDLADINVDDIADIQVVKGASASALYGSRAGAGVLVITTKRGSLSSAAKVDIKYRTEYGISNLTKEIELSQHHAYRLTDDYKQPGFTKYYGVTYPDNYNGGGNPLISGSRVPDYDHYSDNPFSFVNNMQKEIFPQGNFYTHYVSVASSSERLGALLSFENNHNSGIVFNKKGSDRQNFRCNADLKITDNLKLTASSLLAQTTLDLPNGGETESDGGGTSSIFYDVLFMNPDINLNMNAPDTMQLKKYYIKPDQWALGANPKHALYYEKRTTERTSLMQNYSLNYNILKGIDLDASYSFERRNIDVSRRDPPGYLGEMEVIKKVMQES